jgi:hypothetical protein
LDNDNWLLFFNPVIANLTEADLVQVTLTELSFTFPINSLALSVGCCKTIVSLLIEQDTGGGVSLSQELELIRIGAAEPI